MSRGPDGRRPGEEAAPGSGAADAAEAVPRWKRALRWGENLLWLGLLGFALVRLGPQVGAWLGIGPTLGSAPDFSVQTLEGATIDTDALRGQVTLVNFWATWCPPCRIEIPALQSLHEEFADDGLVVLGLSTDAGGAASVMPFLEERGVTYPVAMANGRIRNAFGGVTALPTTFILDRDGVIQHRVFGFFAPPAMRAAVRRLLRDPDEPVGSGEGPAGGSPAPPGQAAGSLLTTSTSR